MHAIITVLEVIVALGAIKLLACSFPQSTLAQAWVALF
jgi:hypothetical protein